MWVWPQVPLGGPPPPPPPCALQTPPPPTNLGRPLLAKRAKGGWGEERRRGRGGRGFGLREGSSNYNGGWGGPSKQQLGPDPHLGAPNCGSLGTSWYEVGQHQLLKARSLQCGSWLQTSQLQIWMLLWILGWLFSTCFFFFFRLSGKSKVLVFFWVWSFNMHAPYILSADDLGHFSGIL